MIEKHIYQCEVCGKTFDDEDDCREHEMEHIPAKLKGVVVMMDSLGEVLPLDDIHTAIERAYAIYVGCKEAADILWEMFDDEGYNAPLRILKPLFSIPLSSFTTRTSITGCICATLKKNITAFWS